MANVDDEKRIVAFRSRRTIAWLSIAASIVFAVFLISVRKETVPVPSPITHWHPKTQTSAGNQSQPVRVTPPVHEKQPSQQPTTTEDAELIANLDLLENMDVIQNYDDLEYLEAAVIANGEEKTE